MTARRAVAALAAILTALLLQATLVAPLTLPVPVSLPAVLVAVVALAAGPGTAIPFGFVTGLVADLGSEHPAGALALCWLVLGVCCGLLADLVLAGRRAALVAGIGAAVSSAAAAVLLGILGASGDGTVAIVRDAVPAAVGDVVLALLVTPVVRGMLGSNSLRRPTDRHPAGRVPRSRPRVQAGPHG
ncbi:MAG TPA: hypothetical protein VK816_08570 [Jatrophihabitantaceae bacterium]|jgi:hypothetical protein|nr:hypothetical protein [Jatrophihabitantaceae bacterium]